jgi:ornithine cyclodeaminase/alanine dehydrogenase-like protein (mu-crystallin family)
VGQFRPGELDDECVTRAGKIFVDSKSQFPFEADDITNQVKRRLLSWENVSELSELVVGRKQGRESPEEITLLKTVGTAAQDLFPAARVYTAAVKMGLGRDLGELFPPALGWYLGQSPFRS